MVIKIVEENRRLTLYKIFDTFLGNLVNVFYTDGFFLSKERLLVYL